MLVALRKGKSARNSQSAFEYPQGRRFATYHNGKRRGEGENGLRYLTWWEKTIAKHYRGGERDVCYGKKRKMTSVAGEGKRKRESALEVPKKRGSGTPHYRLKEKGGTGACYEKSR